MKIFHTTDPHDKFGHIKTAINKAGPGSLIAISGDIILWDGIAEPERLQNTVFELKGLALQAAKKNCHLALCSGNHDDWSTPAFGQEYWLDVKGVNNLHGDFTNKIIQIGKCQIIVTCIPWRNYEAPLQSSFLTTVQGSERRRLAKDTRCHEKIITMLDKAQQWYIEQKLPWVWLHHNPPSNTPASGNQASSDTVLSWIAKYQPTAVLCGHLHTASLPPNGQQISIIGNTLLSNPGRTVSETRFNELDIKITPSGVVHILQPKAVQEQAKHS